MTRLSLALLVAVGLSGCGGDVGPHPQCDSATNPCTDPAAPICDPATHTCVAAPDGGGADLSVPDAAPPDLTPMCATSAQCGDLMPICSAGACRGCSGAADDAECAAHKSSTPRCDSTSHACVACRASTQDSDCATTTTVFDTGVCRKCKAHAECTSLVCKSDGTCATAADILYVDNKGGGCTGTHTGAPTDPFCDIQPAITALAGQHFIRVIGSLASYGAVALDAASVTLVGPGGKAMPPAKIIGNASPAITFGGATAASSVIDGFDVSTSFMDAIDCYPTATTTLTVRNCYVHDVSGAGIAVSRCDLTLDRNLIGPSNVTGGLSLSNSTYAITNNFIVANGNKGAGVTFSNGTTGVFRHNTVVSNLTTSGIGGIQCNVVGNPVIIENSIVWMNTKGTGGSQVGGAGTCTLTNVDIDETAAGTGNTNVQPDFVNTGATDYHLNGRTANNLACCVDQITNSPVNHDYDGSPRPLNVKWDIGAHEVP